MSVPLDFETVFQRSPAPTMILDKTLCFVAANPAYLTMVGRSWEELAERFVFDAFPEAEERIEAMKALFNSTLEGDDTTLSEVPFRITIDGKIREEWWTIRHARLLASDNTGPYLIQFSENVSEQVKIREMRNALVGELQHRVGNIFSIVFAIARQTGRKAGSVTEFISTFEDRLKSLVSLNKQLVGNTDSHDQTIASVIDHQLAVYSADAIQRISISGPDYPLSMHQSQAVSMAIHELAANSLKYGAIGQEGSRIDIAWDVLSTGNCLLTWEESNIEGSGPSEKVGYGTMLLTTIIPSQLNGQATREFGRNSFRYSLEIGQSNNQL